MPKVINNQLTTNNYSDAAALSVVNVFESQGGWIVNNGQILCQQQISIDTAQGSETFSDEFPLPAGAHYLLPGTIGLRCRSFTANNPVTVSICLFQKYEPAMILGSFGQGATTPAIITQQIFTANATYQTPAGCIAILVECLGGGGAGGGSPATSVAGTVSWGGGGQGGCYASILQLNPTTSYAVTVGAGGLGQNGLGGNNGQNTLFGTICRANGGIGGLAGAIQSTLPALLNLGGSGAAAGIGSILLAGMQGDNGEALSATMFMSGKGGSGGQRLGGRGAFPVINQGANGTNGDAASGDGGSGSISFGATGGNAAAHTGGNGGSGLVVVTEYY